MCGAVVGAWRYVRLDGAAVRRRGKPVGIFDRAWRPDFEFDAVVVVEPAAIAGDHRRGLRLLYVALTRPIQHLSIVHAQPLPSPLRG